MSALMHVGARRQSSGVFAAAEEERREEQLSAQHIQTLELTPLGGGAEVGRSCLILKFRGKTIMLDCGLLPSFTGMLALPFLSELNPADIDIVIITHFHIDHAAGLPYFTERMAGFRGRIFATYPTIAVMKIVLSDYVKVSTAKADTPEGLYTQEDVNSCVSKMEAVDLYSKIDVDGVKMQFFNAGHVLGAAMVLMDIAGVRVLYTGDYSCEEDRHLMAAALPRSMPPVDVLIVEATHGMTTLESREKRETRFCESIIRIVKRGGRCLIPQFALGRAQELLLIVDELWESNPELQHIPVYFANNMASKGLEVYRTFVNYMNEKIQNSFGSYSLTAGDQPFRNPWDFKHIRKIRGKDDFKVRCSYVVVGFPPSMRRELTVCFVFICRTRDLVSCLLRPACCRRVCHETSSLNGARTTRTALY
jgi:cleavage and polyadenylation specificity factor subunit 3